VGYSHLHQEQQKALLDQAERLVFEIAERESRGRRGFRPIKELLVDALDRIDMLFQRDNPITGVATGYYELDTMTSGLQKSDLVIIAGRPSMGNTSFALNIAQHAAIKENLPVAVFSMEMPAEQLAMRMMSSLGRIDQQQRLARRSRPPNCLAVRPLQFRDRQVQRFQRQ